MLETAPLLQKFLRVQPRAFGAVLVVLGLLQVALGVLFLIVQCCYTDGVGIHFFSGIPLFLAGVISVTADKVPSVGLVKACLIFHIISATTAAVINFLYVRDILYYLPTFCTFTDKVQYSCRMSARFVFYCTGLRGLAFSTGMTGIFLAIFLAVVCCKTVCYQMSEDTAPVIALHSQDGRTNPQ